MRQTHKSEIQKAFVADFRHQATFHGKEKALADMSFSFDETEPTKTAIDFGSLDFSKNRVQAVSTIQSRIERLKIISETEFDFASGHESKKEIQELEQLQKEQNQRKRSKSSRKFSGSLISNLFYASLYIFISLGIASAIYLDRDTINSRQPVITQANGAEDLQMALRLGGSIRTFQEHINEIILNAMDLTSHNNNGDEK